MSYPFRFRLGDHVVVTAGPRSGETGTVKALELSHGKTVAVLDRGNSYAPIRENEANLSRNSGARRVSLSNLPREGDPA